MLQRLMKLGKIKNIVHDRDARCSILIKGYKNLTEYFDPGHARKSFNRALYRLAFNLSKIRKIIQQNPRSDEN